MLEQFQEYLRENGSAENTVASYSYAVTGYMTWYRETFGQDLERLYRANIQDYAAYLQTVQQLTSRSINVKLAALQALNHFFLETGRQSDLVLEKKDYLKIQTAYANPTTVTRKQVEAFRQRVLIEQGARDYAIVTIMAYAGLRVSEALALCLSDVDLTAGELLVRSGKGGKSRVVFIGDKVVNAVREYLKVRPETDSLAFFISRKGGSLSRGQVNRIFNAHSNVLTPHMLRHFYCSAAIEAGYSIHEVANQAGHSNIHTTLLYTNPTREKMKEKAKLL